MAETTDDATACALPAGSRCATMRRNSRREPWPLRKSPRNCAPTTRRPRKVARRGQACRRPLNGCSALSSTIRRSRGEVRLRSRKRRTRRGPVPPDLETPLRRGEPLGVLFDANVLLDVFLQRANAYPAARALTLAEADAVKGHVCASAFGVICHHGAASGPGRGGRERRLARYIMRFLDVLPLTEDVLTAALGYESLSFEDAQVAAAGDLAGVHAILTSDAGFVECSDRPDRHAVCGPRVPRSARLSPRLTAYVQAVAVLLAWRRGGPSRCLARNLEPSHDGVLQAALAVDARWLNYR